MPEQQVTVPASLLQRFVGFIEKSGSLLEKVQQDGELAKQAAPAAAESLVKHGLIEESQKAAAVETLSSNHATALETLKRAASHVAPTSMGSGVEKSASDASTPIAQAEADFNKAMGF